MRKIFVSTVLLVMALSACGKTAPAESSRPAKETAKPTKTAQSEEIKPVKTDATKSPQKESEKTEEIWSLPAFIPTVRSYSGAGYDEFQISSMVDMGLQYVQGIPDFSWLHIEPQDDQCKWDTTDTQMDLLAENGMRTIAFVIIPKLEGLHWDESIQRNDPRFIEEYSEFAFEIVHRYHTHPAWSGLVAVWGGSSDVWGGNWVGEPGIVIPLMNAAYESIKRADPSTIVIGFNMATTFTTADDWKQWHERAFALIPLFDWFGVQSHAIPATLLESPDAMTGVAGLTNVRAFLDEHGYAEKPI